MADRKRRRTAAIGTLVAVLDAATSDRAGRQHIIGTGTGPEPAWVAHERDVMHAAVNEIRAGHGLPPVDLAAIEQIDSGAAGHIDWRDKFVLRCASLAIGEEASRG